MHALSVFYTLSIAKKLSMLKDDMFLNDNMGRWIMMKTKKYPKAAGTVLFSNQLLKYIDYQKSNIMVKYDGKTTDILFERLHNLMHEYTKIDPKKNYPSLAPDYDIKTRKKFDNGCS